MSMKKLVQIMLLPGTAPAVASAQSNARTAIRTPAPDTPVRNDDVTRFWKAFDAVNANTDQRRKLEIIGSRISMRVRQRRTP